MPSGSNQSNQRKLILVVVDSLRSDMLLRTVEAGDAPTFKKLLDRGELVPDCVSSFPSVTPVCTSEITTGVRPDQHHIPGMNWYHRAEERYVEYGSSFEATRLFGLFRSLYDTVYNLNMGHLNHETLTCFERLGDAGFRTACTPFLIYRGRTRHEVGLEGLLKAAASAAKFHHAVWGPDELFYGELYSSRKVDCKPTLARPATRDAYSACVGRDLVEHDLYDFMLFSLPDNDYFSHRDGPAETQESIALADDALAELVDAHGGIDPFLEANGVIVVADHAQSHVTKGLPLAASLGGHWDVLQPNAELDEVQHELAVGPSGRGAGVWVLREPGRERDELAANVRSYVNRNLDEQVELIALAEPRRRQRRRGRGASRRARAPVRPRRRRRRPARRALVGGRRPGDADRRRPRRHVRLRRLPRCPRAPVGGAPEPERRRCPAQPRPRLGVRGLGRGDPHPRRQPRFAARRGFAGDASDRRPRG
ncbi:MAG: alkaline phosphatase family protein [Solirubrobacterales bacterium]